MKIFTIGFTKKSAEKFFGILSKAEVKRIVDIRLNNVSQLAGFAKRDDLRYFLKTICDADYVHMPDLAPTKEILEQYKKNKGDWSVYEASFLKLMRERKTEEKMTGLIKDGDCLLCSEAEPDQCHRRLVAEYLRCEWLNIKIRHL